MKTISEIVTDVTFSIEGDLAHIYTDRYFFLVPTSGLDHLKYGLEAHYRQTEELFTCSEDDLSIYNKKRPKRSAIDEINYQIERKRYNGEIIKASSLISRLPVFSQSRNRNGKQYIADRRWKLAITEENPKVLALIDYYNDEEAFIRSRFPNISWTRGSFAISPCHIYPALKDRGEDSWSSDKILRDLSIVNKVFDKISASPLKGKHAIDESDANIALDYLESFDWDDLSVSRQVLYLVLNRRLQNGFYINAEFTDLELGI